MTWIIASLTLVLLIVIILILKLKIRIYYCYQKNNHHLQINVYLVKLRVFQRKVNLSQHAPKDYSKLVDLFQDMKEEEFVGVKQLLNNAIEQMKEAKRMLLIMMSSIVFHHFTWKTHFGTGDASSTGVATGGVWMIKGTLLGAVYELSNFKCEPKLMVTPHFQQKGFYSEVDCMVSIRLGKAIHTAVRLIRNSNVNREVYS
jgi:hypothetical protein